MSEQKKPMSALDYIKNQPHLQGKNLATSNQFSALAEFPPLTYAKAVNQNPSTSTQNPTEQKSTYFNKPQQQHLTTTSFIKPITLKDLTVFTSRVFYEDSQYPTDNPSKNRTFYEFILVDTGSIEIVHHTGPKDPTFISYSTCKILKILSIQDLGFINLHTTKDFNTPGFHIKGFTYTDYQKAFFNTFYLRTYDHSWFFSFDFHCPKSIPGWFYEWWHWFGPCDQIYPPSLSKVSLPFYLRHEKYQPIGPLPKIAFHIDMGIPWILSWHYNLVNFFPNMPYSLVREYRVKWWDKYNLDRCSVTNLEKWTQTHKQLKQSIATVSKTLTPVRPRKQSSPTQSTASSSDSKKSRSKEKLKKMLKAIVMQISSDESNEESDEDCTQDLYGGPLAQDPFEE